MEYLYDGSFDGLLTCIYENYYKESATGIYPQSSYQPTLMTETSVVVTDRALAARVYEAIQQKIAADSLALIYHAYLSSSSSSIAIRPPALSQSSD